MSRLEEMLEFWRKGVTDPSLIQYTPRVKWFNPFKWVKWRIFKWAYKELYPGDEGYIKEEETYKRDILLIKWSPKWKWFQPPQWKIFRWAYNINETLLKGCYPSAIHTENEIIDENTELTFNVIPYNSPLINQTAEKILERHKILNQYKENEQKSYLPEGIGKVYPIGIPSKNDMNEIWDRYLNPEDSKEEDRDE